MNLEKSNYGPNFGIKQPNTGQFKPNRWIRPYFPKPWLNKSFRAKVDKITKECEGRVKTIFLILSFLYANVFIYLRQMKKRSYYTVDSTKSSRMLSKSVTVKQES